MIKILAVASEGGHWKQLNQLNDFFSDYNTVYVTTNVKMTSPNGEIIYYLPDANKDKKIKMFVLFLKAFYLLLQIKPDVIVSTGAAPGLSLIFWGSFFKIKTIWIDSIANANELSLSGKIAKKYANVVLSQWPEVAKEEGVLYKGALIK